METNVWMGKDKTPINANNDGSVTLLKQRSGRLSNLPVVSVEMCYVSATHMLYKVQN